MKISVVFLIFCTFVLFLRASAFKFLESDWSGVIESAGKINGVETRNNEELSTKAEKAIKKLIEKHLAKKKAARNRFKKNVQPTEVKAVLEKS